MVRAVPSIRWNLAANFVGQGWRALMALLFVPFYLRILGVEAYGLIGLYAGLQLALALFDAGLRPTLAREMARFTGGAMNADGIRTLLRSIELPLLALSAIIALIMVAAAPWLAAHWVHPQSLDPATVTQAFRMMGLVAAAQFLEAAYDSSLSGLQRQVLQNVIVTFIATLRGFGALVVLWLDPRLTAFFLWQAAVAGLSCLLLAVAVYRSLPPASGRVHFSGAALKPVRRYALGVFGIALLSLLLTQSDKFVLARFMPLADVGQYALAASLVGAIAMLSGPIGNAFYPRLTQLRQIGDQAALARTFHRLSSLMALVVGSAAAMLVQFGDRVMNAWIHDPDLSARAAPVLALLALSGLFNTLTSLPYLLQLANGVTGLTLRINLAMLVIFVPMLLVTVSRFGGIGAAACAAGLNLSGMILSAALTFPRLLPGAARQWWLHDLARPIGLVFGAAFVLARMVPVAASPGLELLSLLLCGGLVLGLAVAADDEIRSALIARIRRFYGNANPGENP